MLTRQEAIRKIERPFGIADSAQNTRAHVVDHGRNRAEIINFHIGQGKGKNVVRRSHRGQGKACGNKASEQHNYNAACNCQCNSGMNGITDPAPVVCAVILGNDNSCTGRKPDEKATSRLIIVEAELPQQR